MLVLCKMEFYSINDRRILLLIPLNFFKKASYSEIQHVLNDDDIEYKDDSDAPPVLPPSMRNMM